MQVEPCKRSGDARVSSITRITVDLSTACLRHDARQASDALDEELRAAFDPPGRPRVDEALFSPSRPGPLRQCLRRPEGVYSERLRCHPSHMEPNGARHKGLVAGKGVGIWLSKRSHRR